MEIIGIDQRHESFFARCAGDKALAQEGALIAVVSMIRRGSVVVAFLFGALLLHEKNLKHKAVDLALILIGLFFLYLGSK